ncbi:hypothetical protein FDA94_13840 [Herbidospora galbida]|uniref:Uncharacterized protein n=1 Tax=Herbidospora galbida TaxID=2575442 RepID=A0A4U3MK35_9ACTN|nr:hypothetical protein FDA94_13840 [Herbidospora galbida]
MRRFSAGVVGGLLATGAMSVVMLAGGRIGLLGEQPPQRIIPREDPGPGGTGCGGADGTH